MNKMKIKTTAVRLLLALLLVSMHARAQEHTGYNWPKLFTPAPVLTVDRWLAGKPVNTFEKGNVYLIELTHVNCGACNKAIPHLTQLARQFSGAVDVVSVYTYYETDRFDAGQYRAMIRDLQEDFGKDMDFSIAVDVRENTTRNTWASRYTGVPVAFVVDQRGRLVWQGHGLSHFHDLEKVLSDVLAGTFDANVYLNRRHAFDQLLRALQQLAGEGNYREVVARADSLLPLYAERAQDLLFEKFAALASLNDSRANRILTGLLDDYPAFVRGLTYYFRKGTDVLDAELGLRLADRIVRHAGGKIATAYALINKARLHEHLGQLDQAVALCDSALSIRQEIDFLPGRKDNYYLNHWIRLHVKQLLQTSPDKAVDWLKEQMAKPYFTPYMAGSLKLQLTDSPEVQALLSAYRATD